jgi:hypothetical protein
MAAVATETDLGEIVNEPWYLEQAVNLAYRIHNAIEAHDATPAGAEK